MLESKFPSAFVLKWIVPLGVFRWMVGQYIMRWLPSMNTLSRLTMSVQEIFPMSKIQNLWYLWYLLVEYLQQLGWKKNCVIISTACTIFTLLKTSPSCYWSLCEDQGKINISPLSKEFYKNFDGFSALMMMIYWEPFSKRSIGRFWVKRRRRSLCSLRPVARRKTHRHCKTIYSSSAARRTSASSTSQTMTILRLFKNKFTFLQSWVCECFSAT